MGKRFSTLLLTGKAATLPMLLQQAQAVTPSYADIVTTNLTQVELPVSNQVRLDSLGGNTPHGGSASGAVTLCSDSGVASEMSLVVTGLQNGDAVYVITSTSTGGNEALDARIKVGNQNLLIPVSSAVSAPVGARVAMTIPLNLTDLSHRGYSLARGSKFYLQTLVFPSGTTGWSAARISELDVVTVDNCSTYGTNPYGGSTY